MIAKELYLLHQEVKKLEKRKDLENKLRKAKAERERMRNVLDGSKNYQTNHWNL